MEHKMKVRKVCVKITRQRQGGYKAKKEENIWMAREVERPKFKLVYFLQANVSLTFAKSLFKSKVTYFQRIVT